MKAAFRLSTLVAIVVLAVIVPLVSACSKGTTYDLNDLSSKITVGMKEEDLVSQIGPPSHTVPGENGEKEYRYDSKDGNGSLTVTVMSGLVTNVLRKDK